MSFKFLHPQNNDNVPTKESTSSIKGPSSKYLHTTCLPSSNINIYTVHLSLKTLKCKIKICTTPPTKKKKKTHTHTHTHTSINLPTKYNRNNKLVLAVTKLWRFLNCQLLTKARRHLQLHKVVIGS